MTELAGCDTCVYSEKHMQHLLFQKEAGSVTLSAKAWVPSLLLIFVELETIIPNALKQTAVCHSIIQAARLRSALQEPLDDRDNGPVMMLQQEPLNCDDGPVMTMTSQEMPLTDRDHDSPVMMMSQQEPPTDRDDGPVMTMSQQEPLDDHDDGPVMVSQQQPLSPFLFGIGVSLDHMFGSKTMLDMLSRVGFSASYDE